MKLNFFLILMFFSNSLLFAQNLITGSTTRNTVLIQNDTEQIPLSAFIGRNKVNFKYVALDGKENNVIIDVAGISGELDLDTGGGNLKADLKIVTLFVASEGTNNRHCVGVQGKIGKYRVAVELDFESGFSAITTGMVKDVTKNDFRLILSNLDTGEFRILSNTDLASSGDLINLAKKIMFLIRYKDFKSLSKYVHPKLGLRFAPYGSFDPSDIIFSRSKFKEINSNYKIFNWGWYPSRDDAPIKKTFRAYYREFIYYKDFINADQIKYNEVLSTDTSPENVKKSINKTFEKAEFVDFYKNDDSGGGSLRLVFIKYKTKYYLCALMHDRWST